MMNITPIQAQQPTMTARSRSVAQGLSPRSPKAIATSDVFTPSAAQAREGGARLLSLVMAGSLWGGTVPGTALAKASESLTPPAATAPVVDACTLAEQKYDTVSNACDNGGNCPKGALQAASAALTEACFDPNATD